MSSCRSATHGQLVHAQVVIFMAAATVLGQLEHVLGRYEEADRSFADGEALHRRLRSPMLSAEGQVHWAAMLLDRGVPGDRERAHTLTTSALDTARDGGYGYTETLARQLLARFAH